MEFDTIILNAYGYTEKLEKFAIENELNEPLGFSSYTVGEIIDCLQEIICWREEIEIFSYLIDGNYVLYKTRAIPSSINIIICEFARRLVEQIYFFDLVNKEQQLSFDYYATVNGKFKDIILVRTKNKEESISFTYK